VHLLGEVRHPKQPYAGEKYDVDASDCIVPVVKAVLVGAPGGTYPQLPSGCVLVRQVQRLTYGGDVVRIPTTGFGFRPYPCETDKSHETGTLRTTKKPHETGQHYLWLKHKGLAGSENRSQGFVLLDMFENGAPKKGQRQQDVTHASPDELFMVPEWWVQPASYFADCTVL